MADAPVQESKVVDTRNENRVLFRGTEDDCRDFIERNFPRHHADPAAPVMEEPVTDVLLVLPNGQKEAYLGPEETDPWQRVKAAAAPGGKS